MAIDVSLSEIAAEIKKIYVDDPSDAEARIQTHLTDRLGSLPLPERLGMLQRLIAQFDENGVEPESAEEPEIQQDIIARLFPLLLGEKASSMDLKSGERLEMLAQALNTIFDTLNKLIYIINTTLRGSSSHEETIRGLIGESLENQSAAVSLVEYLGQIEQAFLLSQKALKEAARNLVEEVLGELDPDGVKSETGSGWPGPFRKAKMLDILFEKHRRCRQWYESSRFEERLVREIEKSCSKYFEP